MSELEELVNRRDLLKVLAGGLAATALPACATLNIRKTVDNINIISNASSISEKQVYDLALQAKREYEKISKFLGVAYHNINIVIGNYTHSRTLYNTRTIEIPSALVPKRNVPTAHEITHVITGNPNLLLSEGLGVYVQDKFGENDVYPNYGFDVHELTVKGAKELFQNRMPNLNTATLYIRDYPIGDKRRSLGYIMAGSFVRYLIEEVFNADIKRFMGMYYAVDYKGHTGKSFGELEKAWIEMLQKHKAKF